MATRIYQFASFELDPSQARLRKGSQFVPLRPKTFALLEYLLASAGRLVTRADLIDALWPGVNVGEEGLTTCVYELREVLNDKPRKPRFIETVHRRGYRFVAPVASIDSEVDALLRSPGGSANVPSPGSSAKRQLLLISGDFSWVPLGNTLSDDLIAPLRNGRSGAR